MTGQQGARDSRASLASTQGNGGQAGPQGSAPFPFFFFQRFTEFVPILFLFYVLIFWLRGMWDLISLTRDQTGTPGLEGKVSTPGLPGESLYFL